jgi:hypothetical protein
LQRLLFSEVNVYQEIERNFPFFDTVLPLKSLFLLRFKEQHTENTTFERKWARDYPREVFWRERIEKARSRIFCSHYQDAGQDPTA